MGSWIFESRASYILYNFIMDIDSKYVFLMPSNICPIVPAVFLKAKKKIEFIDISLETLCLDIVQVSNRIKNLKFPAVLYVRNMGIEHDVENLFCDWKKINSELIIIDDRCQSRITFNEQEICISADLTLFSTGYAKYLDLGYGGLSYMNSKLVNYKNKTLTYDEYDLTTLTTALRQSFCNQTKFEYKDSNWLDSQRPACTFSDFKEIVIVKNEIVTEHKKQINEIYLKELNQVLIPKYNFEINNWRFTVISRNRLEKEKILNGLFSSGLFASSHYASRSHLFGGKKSQNAEFIQDKIINLFNNEKITKTIALEITKKVNECLV